MCICLDFFRPGNVVKCRNVCVCLCVDMYRVLRLAAGSQFVTHTIGRMLGRLDMRSTSINTKGYESLLALVDNTNSDSFELFYGLFMYNVNATEEIERMEIAFDEVKKELFGRMHTAVRQQLFEDNLRPSLPPSNASSSSSPPSKQTSSSRT